MNNLKIPQYWLQTTDSTMREARVVSPGNDLVLVSTVEQTTGRGTKGRIWLCSSGNIFMTVAIQRKLLGESNLPLLPLNTGIILHDVYSQYVHQNYQGIMSIKWPNDILFETRKVSGVLIESDTDYLYIGIGINTTVAPIVTDGGRHSGCLNDYVQSPPSNREIILNIYQRHVDLTLNPISAEEVIKIASQKMNWKKSVFLRSSPEKPWQPICLTRHGGLIIRDEKGEERTLASEYLE